MSRATDVRIVRWDRAQFVARAREAMTIYADAMDYPARVVPNRTGYARSHAERPGFRAVAAVGDGETLLGFGYGYTTARGQWWHDQVAVAISPESAHWLPASFELCELHVTPSRQGGGLGRTLLLTLLDGVEHAAVLLSTPEGDSRAWRLYRSLGFVDLARHHMFPGDARPFAVLGARLPLVDTARPPHA